MNSLKNLLSIMSGNPKRSILWGITATGLILLAWLSLTGAVYGYVRFYRHVSTVGYIDLALPTRWPLIRIKWGDHYISQGLAFLDQGKFPEGLYQLRVGLARAPANKPGRLALAQIFDLSKRPDLAQSTLLDGLKYHAADSDYVWATMAFLLARAEDQQVLNLCTQMLAKPSTRQGIREIAALNAATAHYYRGNYDKAEGYLNEYKLTRTLPGQLLLAQCDWERGYRQLALHSLRELNGNFPRAENVYAQLSSYLRIAGQTAVARQLAVLHQIAVPESISPYIDQLVALLSEENPGTLETASLATFAKFQHDPSALLVLGDFAASNGRDQLAKAILDHFVEQNWGNETTARLIHIEALLVAQKYSTAQAQLQDLLAQPKLSSVHATLANGFLAIAQYGQGDMISAHASLATMMAQSDLRAESLLAMANRLMSMGQLSPARELLNHAVSIDPRNQPALTRLIELDIANRNIPALMTNLPALFPMRKPSPAVLTTAQNLLRSDAYLFLPNREVLLASLAAALRRKPEALGVVTSSL